MYLQEVAHPFVTLRTYTCILHVYKHVRVAWFIGKYPLEFSTKVHEVLYDQLTDITCVDSPELHVSTKTSACR